MSRREIFEEINIGRTKAANVIAKDTRLRAGYENFQGKRQKEMLNLKTQKCKPISTIFYNRYKKFEA